MDISNLNPRTVMVTGGVQGIGRSIAEQLVKEGWAVGLINVHPDVEAVAKQLGAIAALVPVLVGQAK